MLYIYICIQFICMHIDIHIYIYICIVYTSTKTSAGPSAVLKQVLVKACGFKPTHSLAVHFFGKINNKAKSLTPVFEVPPVLKDSPDAIKQAEQLELLRPYGIFWEPSFPPCTNMFHCLVAYIFPYSHIIKYGHICMFM